MLKDSREVCRYYLLMLHSTMLKILKVLRFDTKSSIEQYFLDTSLLKHNMKQEIATQGYYMLQRCMRCNLWIYLIQFLVQIRTPQIKQEKKQREARIFNFISYITLINQSEPRDNFDCSYYDPKGKRSQLFLYFVYSLQPLNYIAFGTIKL